MVKKDRKTFVMYFLNKIDLVNDMTTKKLFAQKRKRRPDDANKRELDLD